jgi:hypothetical protein
MVQGQFGNPQREMSTIGSKYQRTGEGQQTEKRGQGQFGNPQREMSTIGSKYQRTGEGQQTEKTQCMYGELSNVRNRLRM